MLAIGVDDVDATVAKVESLGGAVHNPATTMEGVGRMAMLADLQGAMFYVMRGASDESSDVFSVTDAGHCRWNELSTSDAPSAMAFYHAAIGLQHNGGMPMGEAGEYAFIAVGETTIGAISSMMPPGALPPGCPISARPAPPPPNP